MAVSQGPLTDRARLLLYIKTTAGRSAVNTYSVSMNICKNGRDYELESLLEADCVKSAAMLFIKDWIDEIIFFSQKEFFISVSECNGDITVFIIKNNILTRLD